MNENVKYIVEKLNKEPFKKNLNFISFDNLTGVNLLQLLNDVFAEIDSKQKCDIRDEGPDQTAIRMFNLLKVLKYKPQDENVQQFRQGLVTGDKIVVHPIMKWCLEKLPELKKRAYLAIFLVKLELPPEFLSDPMVYDLNQQYENLIGQFVESHKNYDHLMSTQHTTADLKNEIEQMEDEKEQLIKRLERVKNRVSGVNNSSSMLELSREYRLEVEREEKINQQKSELKGEINQLDVKIDRLEKVLKEQQASYHDLNAESIIQKMEEENRVNSYLANEKFPKEIDAYKKKLKDCEEIGSKAVMTQAEIADIRKRIENVNKEVSQLIEKRDKNRDLSDEKLIMFRQQAIIISRKKDQLAENLKDLRLEQTNLEKQLKEKGKNFGEDGPILKGEDFKRYVIKLRSKGNNYKSKRQEIAELQAEYVTIKRTEEIIKKKFDEVKEHLPADERSLDDDRGRNLKDKAEELMSKKEIASKISSKKSELAPILKDVKALREAIDNISGEYETKKSKYDQINAGYESNRSQLEAEVRALADDNRIFEARYHYFNSQKLIYLVFHKRANDEVKAYTKNNSEKSLRDQLNKKINEQEVMNKTLKDKQKTAASVQVDGKKQIRLWKDLLRQMELKRKLAIGNTTEDLNEAYSSIPDDFEPSKNR
ncbi:unnamed protein product [Brachionus calyciflorus]|uniref:Intraflagellar transport protein 81 homolog n=1 Tax=Brachionus calyciflorus TaxID=104777 RepID=A0A814N1B7_9BILA|nr:unnamed protein product [Brachionus calyciflorus]